ncbi:hypothetical protein KY284_000440 [Solanum tuberosum]|nr:hypothetical protein KY284_000440 [Solanum tuberosum]
MEGREAFSPAPSTVRITLSDANGNLPKLVIEGEQFWVLWQFNFSDFNRNRDQYAEASIKLLVNSGIDFERNLKFGIRSIDFGANDIGYLLKILRGRNLPDSLDVFYDFVKMFFGGGGTTQFGPGGNIRPV